MDNGKQISRRAFLRLCAASAGGALLAACQPQVIEKTVEVPVEKEVPVEVTRIVEKEGETVVEEVVVTATPAPNIAAEISVWHQDWDGLNRILAWATGAYSQVQPEVTVNLVPTGYGDLLTKMLPAVAAGNEGDVNYLYTDWVGASDVTQVFLDITDIAGGIGALEERFFPAALTAVAAPEGKVYYYPYVSGLSDCVLCLDSDDFAAEGVDWNAWDDLGIVIEDCKKVTKIDDAGTMTHASYSMKGSYYHLMFSLAYQLGGTIYDTETATWKYSSDEGIAALQFFHDVIHKDRLFDWDFVTDAFQDMANDTLSMISWGSWTYSVLVNNYDLPIEAVPMPSHPDAVERVLSPSPIGSWALSKRLPDDPAKLDAAIGFVDMIMSTTGQLQAMDFYSGSLMSPQVYADPRLADTKYGEVSKAMAEAVWPIARYPLHHVANPAAHTLEVERALTNEISIEEAAANLDEQMQALEDTALERLGM